MKVEVDVTADPKPVRVMLMNAEDAAKFKAATGDLFGGSYTYRQALAGRRVLTMNRADVIPTGDWTVVVMRPQDSVLFKESTAAKITLTLTAVS